MIDEFDIKLNRNEIAVLRQLIHLAVQARGMEVAEAAVVLSKKINIMLESFDSIQQQQTSLKQTPLNLVREVEK